MPLLILPKSTTIGDIISYANYKMTTEEGRKNRYTFAGSDYFNRMVKTSLYSISIDDIKNRIKQLNLENIFNVPLV